MSGAVLASPYVVKEVRALLPVWLAALSCAVLGVALGDRTADALGLFACAAGSIGLGAMSFGQEYTHGTLPSLLTQPITRTRVFLTKTSVLAVMLTALAGVASSRVLYPSTERSTVIALSVLTGLSLAPYLTVLTRNPLAGAVFSMTVPGLLWIAVAMSSGPHALVVFWPAMLAVAALAAALSWGRFARLEAIESRGADLRFSTTSDRSAPTRRDHPMWALLKKELGVQQLALAVAGVYVASWCALRLAGRFIPPPRVGPSLADVLGALTVLYSGLLALVIGSLGSAEERQLGTLEWQLLQPVPLWQQWMVKVGVVLGLAVLLLIALPALVVGLPIGHVGKGLWYACVILLLTCVSLNVSSLNSNGLRAFLLSIPVSLAAIAVMVSLASMLGLRRLTAAPLGVFAGFLAVVLYFAFVNHRSVERSARRVAVQVFCLAGCLALGAALLVLP